MTAAMGLMSLGGLDAYQRGAEAVLQARDALLAKRVPRVAIDAGYALNGQDLYRYPPSAMDTHADELGIPMVTSGALFPYTIAATLLAGTEEMRRFSWPGPFGFGARPLYVLRFIPPRHAYRYAIVAAISRKQCGRGRRDWRSACHPIGLKDPGRTLEA
jgi:hypothetical protein